MQDDGSDRPSADREKHIRAAIGGWRDSLIDVTGGSNRLLNLRPSRTGMVTLVRPAAGDLLPRLRLGGTYTFQSLPPALAWNASSVHKAGPS